MELGFVIIEWNQAGGPPNLASDQTDLCDDRKEAQNALDWHQNMARITGRRDRYAIATVTVEEEDLP